MGFSIKEWLVNKLGTLTRREVSVSELFGAAQEVCIRELAFSTCVNMVANAVGRCEFKTYRNGSPLKGEEYYLWNVEPNTNQNSTDFLHKVVHQLFTQNEALIISTMRRSGSKLRKVADDLEQQDENYLKEMLVVADDFIPPTLYPAKMNEYKDVTVGEFTYDKTFRENEVLHLRLNSRNIKPVIDAMYQSYHRLVAAAMTDFRWRNGKHLKVHVSQSAQGDDDFEKTFAAMINEQVRPFFNADSAVLPEFEGYKYDGLGDAGSAQTPSRDIRALVDDIFDFTARGFCIPPVLLFGDVAGTQDAMTRWLTTCIDPLCDQFQEEINRKRYGYTAWQAGTYLQIDTSSILHFDLFASAANVEKLIGSGAYCINDVRVAAGQPPIDEPWAWQHWLTLNIATIESAARAVNSNGKGGESK